MSTGLTYVFHYDNNATVPLNVTGCQVFQDYDEAVNYAIWNATFVHNVMLYGTDNTVYWTIYTTGPNSNGYVGSAYAPVFVAFD